MRSASLWAGMMIESSGESGWYDPNMDPPRFRKEVGRNQFNQPNGNRRIGLITRGNVGLTDPAQGGERITSRPLTIRQQHGVTCIEIVSSIGRWVMRQIKFMKVTSL